MSQINLYWKDPWGELNTNSFSQAFDSSRVRIKMA